MLLVLSLPALLAGASQRYCSSKSSWSLGGVFQFHMVFGILIGFVFRMHCLREVGENASRWVLGVAADFG
jgi:hypothetical protein